MDPWDNLQIEHDSYKLLITGKSGYGKTTYWLRTLLGLPAGVKFIFDHKGEVALRLGCRPCFTPEELGQAIDTGWVIYSPAVMFEGRQPEGFLYFLEFAFRASCQLPGRKIFGCDELQHFVGTSQVPGELAMVNDDGRIRGLDMVYISSAPNIIHNRLRGQVDEVVAFRTDEDNPLEWLITKGFNPEHLKNLIKGEFICRNCNSGAQARGRVF